MYKLNQVPSEAKIKKYFRKILFGKNVYCPECKSNVVIRYGNRYRCRKCKIKFTLISHTWLRAMKLSYQEFWLILWCWTTQIPVKQAQALCSLSEKGVRHWYGLFRSHLPLNDILTSFKSWRTQFLLFCHPRESGDPEKSTLKRKLRTILNNYKLDKNTH